MSYTSNGYSLSISFIDSQNKKGKMILHPITSEWDYEDITDVIANFELVSNARVTDFAVIVSWHPDSVVVPVEETYVSVKDKGRLYYNCNGQDSYMELPAPVLTIFESDEETVDITALDSLATALSLVMENTLTFVSGKRVRRN